MVNNSLKFRKFNISLTFSIGADLTQKLFDPVAWMQYRQAKKGLSIQEQAFEAARQNILCAAKNATPKLSLPFRRLPFGKSRRRQAEICAKVPGGSTAPEPCFARET